jgi:hypothetical protein
MFKCQKNRFWFEKPMNLFCTIDLIPLDHMSIDEQMNCITRLVVIVYFILALIGFEYNLLFLLLSLLFIIILYYIQRNQMREKYTNNLHGLPMPNLNGTQQTVTNTSNRYCNDANTFCNDSKTSNRFCNDHKSIDGRNDLINNPNWTSQNHKLVGGPNPKTLIPPVIVPASHDIEYWRTNNLVVPSGINDETNIDVYQSGYMVSPPCSNQIRPCQINTRENYTKENMSQTNGLPFIKEHCGLQSGKYQHNNMNQYNENIYTEIIQPGVYTRTNINEPINSNIGISYQQQLPYTRRIVDNHTGDILFTKHDPRIIEPVPEVPDPSTLSKATTDNVYDPRFTSYGTSYRSYNEDITGQTRFFYDDVNAIRMPNYIVRSNIDNNPWADQYGPIPSGQSNGNPLTGDIRQMANQTFLDSSIQFRTEMQERLMRKHNANAWQRKQFPIHTSGQK